MEESRTKIIRFRLRPEEHEAVMRAMKENNYKVVSKFIRQVLRDGGVIE